MIDKINIPEFEVSEFNQAFKEVIESNFNYVRTVSYTHLTLPTNTVV